MYRRSKTLPRLKKPSKQKIPIMYRSLSPLKITPRWNEKPLACSRQELIDIIVEPSRGYYELPTDPYNEVYPNIFIGDGTTALCTSLLRRLGITHVLNAAKGKSRDYCLVNTSEGFYQGTGIQFLGIEALDTIYFHLNHFFEESANFIEEALSSGGKVYVHCRAGISRSAALVIAFLMIKRNMSAQEAVRRVREHRSIIPNDGFLKQICELNEKLRREDFNYRS